MSSKNAIITRSPRGGWKSVVNGNSRASFTARTQKQVYNKQVQSFRKSGGGEILVCGRNGAIRNKNTIAPMRDSFPPRG